MRYRLWSALLIGVLTTGCNTNLLFIAVPQIGKETIEARVRNDLNGSSVTSLVVEKRTVKWVVDNHDMVVATGATDGLTPESEIWVAVADGDINPAVMPGQSSAYGWFTQLVILLDPKSGEAMGYKGTPKSSETSGPDSPVRFSQ